MPALNEAQTRAITEIRALLVWWQDMPECLHHRDADALFSNIETTICDIAERTDPAFAAATEAETEAQEQRDIAGDDPVGVFDSEFWSLVEARLLSAQ